MADTRWKQQNKGFRDWLRSGKVSVMLEGTRVSVENTTRPTSPTRKFFPSYAAKDSSSTESPTYENHSPNIWASLVMLSRGQMRAQLTDPNLFNLMYGNTEKLYDNKGNVKQQPSIGLRFGRGIRTVLLGIVQLFDTVIYATPMLLAALQLGFEVLYLRAGRALGIFPYPTGSSQNPYANPIARFFIGIIFIVCGILATTCRLGVFVTKSIADGFGLLLNIANIPVAFTVGLAAAAIKFITGKTNDLGSYTKIARATWTDMVHPFSSKMGDVLRKNAVMSDLSDAKLDPIPTPSWRTIFGYTVATVVVAAVTFFTFGLGVGSIPAIPFIAEFVSGAIAGGSIAAGISAATAATAVTTTPAAIATTAAVATVIVGGVGSAVDDALTAVADNLPEKRANKKKVHDSDTYDSHENDEYDSESDTASVYSVYDSQDNDNNILITANNTDTQEDEPQQQEPTANPYILAVLNTVKQLKEDISSVNTQRITALQQGHQTNLETFETRANKIASAADDQLTNAKMILALDSQAVQADRSRQPAAIQTGKVFSTISEVCDEISKLSKQISLLSQAKITVPQASAPPAHTPPPPYAQQPNTRQTSETPSSKSSQSGTADKQTIFQMDEDLLNDRVKTLHKNMEEEVKQKNEKDENKTTNKKLNND